MERESGVQWLLPARKTPAHNGTDLPAIMPLAPNARLATHGLGALRMASWWPLPLDRVHALALGDRLDVGDRTLRAIRPPTYDNPMSTGIVDESTATLFSVDSFGAILPRAVQTLGELSEDELTGGMTAWATFDSPWMHMVDRRLLAPDTRRGAAPRRRGSCRRICPPPPAGSSSSSTCSQRFPTRHRSLLATRQRSDI